MRLHELYPFPEEQKGRKRIGRGPGSGSGSTAGKGHKGHNARSGGGPNPRFEGGQMPLQRRLPKHGFKNPFRVEYQVVNLSQLETMFGDKSEITLQDMYDRGLSSLAKPVKVLGDGDVSRAIKVQANKFSVKAAEKLKAAGGEAIALEG